MKYSISVESTALGADLAPQRPKAVREQTELPNHILEPAWQGTRVLVRVGRLIPVPQDASEADLERCTSDLQATLDRVCQFAEANVGKVGTSEFPVGDER